MQGESVSHAVVRGALLSSCAIGLAIASAAAAQTATPAPAPDPASATGLEEIVVTAQKRAENLIKVPLSIQAVTATALQNQGITRVEELQNSVPGLSIQYGQGGAYSPFLRGVGNALSGNYAENSIATYIDDVPRPRNRGSTDLPNLERIEVLKGPQGALYGRNATGGAISIVTKEPGRDFAASGKVDYGSFNTFAVQGYVNIPLGETLAINASASHRERDGTVKNLSPLQTNPLRLPGRPAGFPQGGPKGDFDFESVNTESYDLKIKWQPSESFSATLRGDYNRVNDTSASGWVQRTPEVVAGLLSALSGMSITPADFPNGGRPARTTYADQAPIHDIKDYGTSLKLVGDLDGVTLTSISAYRKTRELSSIDIDATPLPIAGFTAFFRTRTISQEVRAVSDNDGPFQWLAGATYFDDKVNDATAGEIGAILIPGFAQTLTREQLLSGQYPRFSLPPTIAHLRAKSWAAFGQVSFDITQALRIIASGRYTEERRNLVFPGQTNTGGLEVRGRRREHAFTPAVTLNYDMGDSGLVYLRWAKGYKSGGLNDLLNPVARDSAGNPVGINEFKPEKLTSYEIGYKAELFDRRLRVTAAAFHYDYRNLQFQRVLSAEATSVVLNAQKARINGAELELSARVNPVLTLSGGVSYTDAKYKRFVVADIVNFDASGHRMISAPKWSAQGTVDLNAPIGNDVALVGSATVSYRTGQFFDPENTQPNHQDGYAVVSGRMGATFAGGRYGAYVFARNLFNKIYALYGQSNSMGTVVNYGDRRVVGGTLEVRF